MKTNKLKYTHYTFFRLSKSIVLILSVMILFTDVSYGQESINPTGGSVVNENGLVSFSVGLPAYSTYSGVSGFVEQGIQHSYDIYSTDSIDSSSEIFVSLFPNPTIESISIRIKKYNSQIFNCRILDTKGQLLKLFDINSSLTSISVSSLPTGVYFLIVNQNGKRVKSFRIIKNRIN